MAGKGKEGVAGARTAKVVYMGDSITAGQYVDPRLRWSALIDAALRVEGLDVESVNFGVSGETTRMGLERFPATVQTAGGDVMTLQYGLNDCNCWQTDGGLPRVSQAGFRANLIEMIHRARRSGIREIILSTNHPTLRQTKMMSGEVYELANARYSEVIRDVAAETGVVLCDVRKAFLGYTEAELADLLLPAPDVLHLSVPGNGVYADVIRPFVHQAVLSVLARRSESKHS